MTSIGEGEWLDTWQPFQKQLLPLAKPRIALLAENSEDGLMNSAGLAGSKPTTDATPGVRAKRMPAP